tara:strand:- start:703 stop:1239 length:537 start_codon:yes stop_codon:yes gene_type:complete
MARPVYQYRPIKTANTIPLGIALPFNKPSGRRSVDAAYNANIEDGGSVFVSTYTTEEQAVSNVKNLLMTAKGERYMQPDFGTNLRTLLFEQNVSDLEEQIVTTLEEDIAKWLPYITIEKIDIIQPDHDIIIRVIFRIDKIGANLVINILVDENNFNVGEVEDFTEPVVETALTQIGEY